MEIYTFFAITMLTELINKNRIQDYIHHLQFQNHEDIFGNNLLEKIKLIIDQLERVFSNGVNPTLNLYIDETLMLWIGRLRLNNIFRPSIIDLKSNNRLNSLIVLSSTSSFY